MENLININDISDESEVLVPTRNAEEKQRKKKHKLIKILVIIVIVAALLFLAYYLFWKHQENKYADPLFSNPKLISSDGDDYKYSSYHTDELTYQVCYFDFPKWDWALYASVLTDTVVDENWNLLTNTRIDVEARIDILGNVEYTVNIAELIGNAGGVKNDNYGAYHIDSDGNMLECLGEDDNEPFNNMADNYYEKHKAEVVDMLNKLYDFFGKDNLVL